MSSALQIPILFTSGKPVLLVDADEVLFQFLKRLEAYFHTQGYELRLSSFRLSGNVFRTDSGLVASSDDVRLLIGNFFNACVDDIEPVAGAADALQHLSHKYQIAILSNVPERCSARRQKSLYNLGMDYPLIANKGDKGTAVKLLARQTNHITVFIDDLPPQHKSVKEHTPDTHRIHFIADPRLQKLTPKADAAHQRIDDWPQLCDYLMAL
ncbi:hypothetical protein [Kordiimonas pumila]|uniref:HAD family hydrolase n=1 Tax=Kordiimonas pumila TaxID=2161677 RepID=A0ABV7D123_9PROT|nr:hypothetical protein [Kordiimonas pumila]